MTIAASDILTFVNNALRRSETDIDIQIQAVLDDLSEADLLHGTDTSQSLESGDTTLDVPTLCRSIIAITLTNDDDIADEPLRELKGGMLEYRRLRDNDSATGIPEYYTEFNGYYYLWRPPDGDYDANIEYIKDHAQDVDNIEFGDIFKNAIYAGAAFEVALRFGLERYIAIWGAKYADAKQKRINAMPMSVHIAE